MKKKLDLLVAKGIERDRTQFTLLSSWLVELYLNELNNLRDDHASLDK